jgi:D-alanine-D-alanine ligase
MSDTVILFGGSSSERLVSVASAQNVSRVLANAAAWFLSASGEVTVVARDELAAHTEAFTKPFSPKAAPQWPSLAAALDTLKGRDVAVFLALHGGEGEDGTIQRMLEERRLAFTGSSAAASALAFDKAKAKQLAGAKGAKLAEARELGPMTKVEAQREIGALLATHPRWVLKPRADGSSHGLVHLRSEADVEAAAELLSKLGLPYLAEVYVEGRELTVGVMDTASGPVTTRASTWARARRRLRPRC